MRFADTAARDLCVHTLVMVRADVDGETWPAPLGWSEGLARLAGARIRPLTSLDEVLREGEAMKNCLRDRRYLRPAMLGRISLLSIEAEDGRATLALVPNEGPHPGVSPRLVGWTVRELRGPRNNPPSPGCENAADALLVRLNSRCPASVPEWEARRRARVRKLLDSRTFNEDRSVAIERWNDLYRNHLPRAFRSVTPATIVDGYLVR